MSLGSVQNILVCTPASASDVINSIDSQVCPGSSGQSFKLHSVQAFVIDPAAQSFFEDAARPFNYEYAGAVWSLAFTMVIALYLVSAKVGAILGLLRR